jgi:response regulator RpfG family c-di-GMP phosphodiesterase
MVDDDEAMRKLVRMRLADTYDVVDTGDPAQAMALALESQPDAILLDVMMPRLSGFELCQSFQSLSYTSNIPIFVISGGGESRAKYEEYCQRLGVKAYIDKPINFGELKSTLASELEKGRPERRNEVRIRMRLGLKLRATAADGAIVEHLATTEDVSAQGFLGSCERPLVKGTEFKVYLLGDAARYAGRARVVRKESGNGPWQRYGFQFDETTSEWVMQQNRC